MPGNENTKSGILQGLFICRTSELNPRMLKEERYLEGDQAQELIILLKQGA